MFLCRRYQWVQQTLLTSIGTEIQVKIIIDFLKNVYIAGLNNPSIINHINFIYDRFSNIQIPPKNIDQRQKEKILIFLEDEKEIA